MGQEKIHVAAPAALGENVLRYAPPGAVQLTAPQRAELLRELDACKQRIADLKFAMGDSAGWFDRAMVAEEQCRRLKRLIEEWRDYADAKRSGRPTDDVPFG